MQINTGGVLAAYIRAVASSHAVWLATHIEVFLQLYIQEMISPSLSQSRIAQTVINPSFNQTSLHAPASQNHAFPWQTHFDYHQLLFLHSID